MSLMAITLNPSTLQRMEIAKGMYLQGVSDNSNYSHTTAISAILNFDYAAETLIKAVLIDAGISLNTTTKSGTSVFKDFPTLIKDLQTKYPSLSNVILNAIDSLHKLRNDVQHNAQIPSQTSITRFESNVRIFFDDILKNIYNNVITFEEISLSAFVESKVAKVILDEMEKAIASGNYDDAVYLARKAVSYLISLVRKELDLPNKSHNARSLHTSSISKRHRRSYKDQEVRMVVDNINEHVSTISNFLNEVKDVMLEMDERVEWLIDTGILLEYKYELSQLLGDHRFTIKYKMEPDNEHVDLQKAEKSRALAYYIIMKMQSILKAHKDEDSAFVFYLGKSVLGTTSIIKAGYASAAVIIESKWELRLQGSNDVIQSGKIDGQGIKQIEIKELEKGKTYTFVIIISDGQKEISESVQFTIP